jgi:hypothetical protein
MAHATEITKLPFMFNPGPEAREYASMTDEVKPPIDMELVRKAPSVRTLSTQSADLSSSSHNWSSRFALC